MKEIQGIEFQTGSREELLPGFTPDFPYIASKVDFDKNMGGAVPWHWHRAVELFYMESGELEYHTPSGTIVFPAGSGGMVNANVLHMTRTTGRATRNIQYLHIFDASLIAGEQGCCIEEKYVTPLISASQIEIIALYPEHFAHAETLKLIREAFLLSGREFGYEIKLRELLSQIWLHLFEQAGAIMEESGKAAKKGNDKIKQMMVYIHEHYQDKITIAELAASAFLSERECFRVFQEYLHMTPIDYIQSYRLQAACQMLARGHETITEISHACGFGSSSYFGKVFREYTYCTPSQYRQRWQDSYK
ncbi:MAG: AraC family transcriptional regulator [Lachnospiraceae bacterium]|nr:AraC family transcriptional regulator [Lachnospiraceae bacterium]